MSQYYEPLHTTARNASNTASNSSNTASNASNTASNSSNTARNTASICNLCTKMSPLHIPQTLDSYMLITILGCALRVA